MYLLVKRDKVTEIRQVSSYVGRAIVVWEAFEDKSSSSGGISSFSIQFSLFCSAIVEILRRRRYCSTKITTANSQASSLDSRSL